jgi:hypothetical protein
MEETFKIYLQKLKERRTTDNYEYSDNDFELYNSYIKDCWINNISVYKCLEFMYFSK